MKHRITTRFRLLSLLAVAALAMAATDSPGAAQVESDVTFTTGLWLAAADGGVFAVGAESVVTPFYGSAASLPLSQPIVEMTSTAGVDGYWLVAADGGVFAFGEAQFHGSLGGQTLRAPVVDILVTPGGAGYWLVAADGGVFSFGDAAFHGSLGGRSTASSIVGAEVHPSGRGYVLFDLTGSAYGFGEAGSAATVKASSTGFVDGFYRTNLLSQPLGEGLIRDGWLARNDGSAVPFGAGSGIYSDHCVGDVPANVVDAAPGTQVNGHGFYLVSPSGTVKRCGIAPVFDSLDGVQLRAPIVAVVARNS